ncbi:DAK2 domain-containing protein [Bianquea renquensis]
MLKSIQVAKFRQMIIAGANRLEEHKHSVDELNVFPVPDGDTGTNMSLTMMSAAREVLNAEGADIPGVAKALSSGALRGARGNSGVIVSQLFRGFYKGLRDVQEIDTATLSTALQLGVETAYKAVMKPKEGTILTVAREIADKALELAMRSEDVVEVLEEALRYGSETLAKTPDMLPVLKEAGVVDAGGQGLLYIYYGMLDALKAEDDTVGNLTTVDGTKGEHGNSSAQAVFSTESITFGYCTEFIVNGVKDAEAKEDEFRAYLSGIGDSLVVVADEDLIKIHVHTNDPGLAIQKGLSYGYLSNMKIDNMRLQHQNTLSMEPEHKKEEPLPKSSPQAPAKEIGFIAVSLGDGLDEIFRQLGVDYVIPGGQTMNPSTEDILNAVDMVNAKTILILPNNKNIILAAQQAALLLEEKTLLVVPSKSVPQGITAMLNYMMDQDANANFEAMTQSLETVTTGQVTYAVRDTHMGDFDIKKDDILALMDGDLQEVGKELDETSKKIMDRIMGQEPELVTIYYGEDVKESQAQELAKYVSDGYDGVDVEVQYGGQPLYYYIISAE